MTKIENVMIRAFLLLFAVAAVNCAIVKQDESHPRMHILVTSRSGPGNIRFSDYHRNHAVRQGALKRVLRDI